VALGPIGQKAFKGLLSRKQNFALVSEVPKKGPLSHTRFRGDVRDSGLIETLLSVQFQGRRLQSPGRVRCPPGHRYLFLRLAVDGWLEVQRRAIGATHLHCCSDRAISIAPHFRLTKNVIYPSSLKVKWSIGRQQGDGMGHARHRCLTTMRSYVRRAKLARLGSLASDISYRELG
jgi:hypothetical protein